MPSLSKIDLKLDVEAAMAEMSETNRSVCLMLLEGRSRIEIAAALGVSRFVLVYRHIKPIQRKFAALGIAKKR